MNKSRDTHNKVHFYTHKYLPLEFYLDNISYVYVTGRREYFGHKHIFRKKEHD